MKACASASFPVGLDASAIGYLATAFCAAGMATVLTVEPAASPSVT